MAPECGKRRAAEFRRALWRFSLSEAAAHRMETIYNLVPEVVVERPKPPMYRSMHDPKAPLAGSTFGIQGTTQVRFNYGPPPAPPPTCAPSLRRPPSRTATK